MAGFGCPPRLGLHQIDNLPGLPVRRKRRANYGSDGRAYASRYRSSFAPTDATWGVTAFDTRADGEPASKSDHCTDKSLLTSSHAAMLAVQLDLQHVLFFCAHRADGHLLRCPALKYAFRRS